MEENDYQLQSITPILRIFDLEKAYEFYLDFLEFELDWEHQYGENFPLYMQITNAGCKLHLSEHHGDCSPGAAIRIEVTGVKAFHAKLHLKNYKFANPGLEKTQWNTEEVTVTDPFGNRLVFYEVINH